jgi:hypothetical protein
MWHCWSICIVKGHRGWEFFSSPVSRTARGPSQPPIQWVPGALFLEVKQLGYEADHSPPSSAEVKEWVELYLHSSNTPSWCGAKLNHKDNFTFTFTLKKKAACSSKTSVILPLGHNAIPRLLYNECETLSKSQDSQNFTCYSSIICVECKKSKLHSQCFTMCTLHQILLGWSSWGCDGWVI